MESIIKNYNYAVHNGFRFYKSFKEKWEMPTIWPTFELQQDYERQNILFKAIDKNASKIVNRPKKDSLRERMLKYNGVEDRETKTSKDEKKVRFRLVDNTVYAFCETYMKRFLVPRIISNLHLSQVCKFRSKGRIPILCYAFKEQKSKQETPLTEDGNVMRSFLWRGSQLKSGIMNHRSHEDEFFVELMHNQLKFKVLA